MSVCMLENRWHEISQCQEMSDMFVACTKFAYALVSLENGAQLYPREFVPKEGRLTLESACYESVTGVPVHDARLLYHVCPGIRTGSGDVVHRTRAVFSEEQEKVMPRPR